MIHTTKPLTSYINTCTVPKVIPTDLAPIVWVALICA